MSSIYYKGVQGDDDHIRIIQATWNNQNVPYDFPSAHAISGIVLVHDTITKEYKAYWGTFAIPNAFYGDELSHARHIAQYGSKVPAGVCNALFYIPGEGNE